jgi:hypothetical protein
VFSADVIISSVLTAALTAAFVSGVNHFWNRKYLVAVEREKYRQTLFSEKLKAYLDITMAIHEFTVCCGETSARLEMDDTADVPQEMAAVYGNLLDVKSIIHRHMLIIPEGTLDVITETSETFLKVIKVRVAAEAKNRIEILGQFIHRIVDALRADLGIKEFGEKLE